MDGKDGFRWISTTAAADPYNSLAMFCMHCIWYFANVNEMLKLMGLSLMLLFLKILLTKTLWLGPS